MPREDGDPERGREKMDEDVMNNKWWKGLGFCAGPQNGRNVLEARFTCAMAAKTADPGL